MLRAACASSELSTIGIVGTGPGVDAGVDSAISGAVDGVSVTVAAVAVLVIEAAAVDPADCCGAASLDPVESTAPMIASAATTAPAIHGHFRRFFDTGGAGRG